MLFEFLARLAKLTLSGQALVLLELLNRPEDQLLSVPGRRGSLSSGRRLAGGRLFGRWLSQRAAPLSLALEPIRFANASSKFWP